MANNLRVFNTNSEYQSADLVHPAVSYVIETDKVHYEPTTPTPSFKWKATYQDSHVESAQCGSSSVIVRDEINRTNLVSVELGDCVTIIGNNAFDDYSDLTSIVISDSVTGIGDSAFYGCRSLTSITIPSGVTSIGLYAFMNCSSLTSINIPDSVTSIGHNVFANCTSLISATIGSGVTIIDNMFENCSGLTSVTIGDGVRSIGIRAFYESTGLTSCTIGSGVTSIGQEAFVNCRSLRSVTVKATTPPTLGRSAFPFFLFACNLYVPSQSVNAYKDSDWKYFTTNIYPIP